MSTIVAHIDCRALTIGSYGYGALSDPNSDMVIALSGLLTLFVALLGLRLMAGVSATGRDIATEMLKIGIVLTLATSWPAWRVMGYDLVFDGPREVAVAIGISSGVPTEDFTRRIQQIDGGIVTLTTLGSGILQNRILPVDGIDLQSGIALSDASGLGWGRIAFLVASLGPIGLLRLTAGILLALAPLLAGFLLFAGTRDLFLGWLRALGFCALGWVVLMLCLSVELSLLASWLQNVLALRGVRTPALSSPTELVVMALAFAVINFGALVLTAKLAFFSKSGLGPSHIWSQGWPRLQGHGAQQHVAAMPIAHAEITRAQRVANAVTRSVLRESIPPQAMGASGAFGQGASGGSLGTVAREPEMLGNSYRRNYRRTSLSHGKRDASL